MSSHPQPAHMFTQCSQEQINMARRLLPTLRKHFQGAVTKCSYACRVSK